MIHRSKNGGRPVEENPWNKRFNPGDLVLLIAQFKDNRPRHGLIIREYSPQVNPGYEVLIDGKTKYLPPHMIRVIARSQL